MDRLNKLMPTHIKYSERTLDAATVGVGTLDQRHNLIQCLGLDILPATVNEGVTAIPVGVDAAARGLGQSR